MHDLSAKPFELVPLSLAHAPALFDLTHESRAHLRVWLPWVDHVLVPEDTQNFVRDSLARVDNGSELHYLIMVDQHTAGIISVIDITAESGVVGYWIGTSYQGKGYVSAAVRQIKRICFAERGFRFLRLEYFKENQRSERVALRCGFIPETIIPQGGFLYGRHLDRVISRCDAA